MKSKKNQQSGSPLLAKTERDRSPILLGLFGALLLAGTWCYPSGAYPLDSVMFGAVLSGTGVLLALESLRRAMTAGSTLPATTRALGEPAALLGGALALYAAARWRWTPVPALGREGVENLLWMGAALLAGVGLAAHSGPDGTERTLAGARRTLVVLAIGLGMLAVYQFRIGYPRAAAELQAELGGPVRDLETQSLLHALRERRVGGRLGNPNLFAAQLAVLAVFCIGSLRDPGGRAWRWLGGLGWLTAASALSLTGSRGGVLTFAVASGAAGWIAWRRPRGRGDRMNGSVAARGFGLALGAAGALAARMAWAGDGGLWERLGRIDTVRERFFYWEIAWKVCRRNPLWGEGPGSFERLYPLLKSPLARESQYAHSWVFQYGAELGLVGLGLATAFWLAAAWRLANALRDSRRRESLHGATAWEAIWPLVAALTLTLNGLFEFSLQWREFLVATGLLAGLGCAGLATARGNAPPKPLDRLASRIGLALLGTGAALALWIGVPLALANDADWQGRMAAREGRMGEAVEAFAEAARRVPDDPHFLVAEAAALQRAGQAAASWTLLERAARLNPWSASVREAQAVWLEGAGRLEDALSALDAAVERYPSKVGYRLNRARLALRLGRKEGARNDLQFVERERLPIWEFEQEPYNAMRRQAGLEPIRYAN